MRALLVVNPAATSTTARGRDVLARALGSDLKVDVAETAYRGHAIEVARQARLDGIDLVIALGGDGTVNEVVNGLLAEGPASDVPALAVVPAGSANVFSRTLGQSTSPVEATSEILDAVRAGRSRHVGLATVAADGGPPRWFTFCAGLGLDAEVVRRVESSRRGGARATPGRYVRTGLLHFFTGTDRRRPAITLHRPGAEPEHGLFLAIACNTTPWTYLGSRPVHLTPRASFERGLDVLAMRRLSLPITLRTLAQALADPPRPAGRHLLSLEDLGELRLTCERPRSLQIDGEYVGAHREVALHAQPRVLRVIV